MIQRSVAMVLLHFVKIRRPYAFSQVESAEETVPPNRALTTIFHPNCCGGNHDGKGAKTDIAGCEVETATTVWNRPSESELFPSVVTAISFHKPGQFVGHGMNLIERHKAALDLDRFLVMADRAYNNSRVETFHIPARKAGVELVFTYRAKDLGMQGPYKDLILVDGNWHVRSMPQKLIDATKDLVALEKSRSDFERVDYDQQHATLLARLHNRSAYRMIAKGLPDLDGYQRFTYPTRSPVPHAPLNGKNSIMVPLMIPETTIKSKEPGVKSRRLQPVKHLQRFAYKSDLWARYCGMRNLVEASNSRFKDSNQEDLGNPKKRSGRGFSSNYLVTALSISSFNLRSIATFILKLRDKAIEKPLRTRRRKDENERPMARLVTTRAAAPRG